MPKTPYSDVTSQEALRLMVNGEEAECLESEEKWRALQAEEDQGWGLMSSHEATVSQEGRVARGSS